MVADTMNASQFSAATGYSLNTITKWLAEGFLIGEKQGRAWKIPVSELERLRDEKAEQKRRAAALEVLVPRARQHYVDTLGFALMQLRDRGRDMVAFYDREEIDFSQPVDVHAKVFREDLPGYIQAMRAAIQDYDAAQSLHIFVDHLAASSVTVSRQARRD